MKTYDLLFPLLVLTTASPATAQTVRTYVCTADGSNEGVRFRFGTGELREFSKGAWSSNSCY